MTESLCEYQVSLWIVGSRFSHAPLVRRCASSKHLQTRRFLDTLQGYLFDVQRILIQLHLSANERAEPFVDHAGVLRDSKTGRAINGLLMTAEKATMDAYDDYYGDTMREFTSECSTDVYVYRVLRLAGYSFFDSGDVELLARGRRMPAYYNTGSSSILFLS